MGICTAFLKAVKRPENRQANGDINWNFIDADCYMDCKPTDDASHYVAFNNLATEYEAKFGKQIQLR